MTFIELTKQRDNTKFLLNYKFIETIQNQENLTYIFIYNNDNPFVVQEPISQIMELIKNVENKTSFYVNTGDKDVNIHLPKNNDIMLFKKIDSGKGSVIINTDGNETIDFFWGLK